MAKINAIRASEAVTFKREVIEPDTTRDLSAGRVRNSTAAGAGHAMNSDSWMKRQAPNRHRRTTRPGKFMEREATEMTPAPAKIAWKRKWPASVRPVLG